MHEMNSSRSGRINRDSAERLLSAAAVEPRGVPDALIHLLAAARAIAQPAELAGESAAMDAFRAVLLGPTPHPRRRSMLQTALAKFLTLKVAAAAVVTVAATGGVALAATNGALPDALSNHSPTAKPSAHSTADDSAKPSASTGAKGSPSPSLVGLCRAYQAGAGDNPGKALENPAFTALITAAGDKDKVTAYCGSLLAAQKSAHPTPKNGPGGAPTTHPTGKADSHPTGAPVGRMTPTPTGGTAS
jgi:hypothetical protein